MAKIYKANLPKDSKGNFVSVDGELGPNTNKALKWFADKFGFYGKTNEQLYKEIKDAWYRNKLGLPYQTNVAKESDNFSPVGRGAGKLNPVDGPSSISKF